jgi:hypothetical protein
MGILALILPATNGLVTCVSSHQFALLLVEPDGTMTRTGTVSPWCSGDGGALPD